MKFHQLAARGREVGHQFHQQFNSGPGASRQAATEMSPIKQQQQQQVAAELNQHLLNLQLVQQQQLVQRVATAATAASDDEDDQEEDFEQQHQQLTGGGGGLHHGQRTTTTSLYESLTQAFAQKHQHQTASNQQLSGHNLLSGQADLAAGPNQEDGDEEETGQAGGFLMDKNKKLFPQKLWELIHNPSIQHCLRWSQDGQRVYLNRNEFEQYYLKTANNQFHTQKAISFVRQMNMYGFRKVDDCYYENDNFRRDRKHLLKNMIRRHPNKGLFVGLDHHQLAAAAAAQQALQVNQQLQQLESQHKQRAEQALRLNNYFNQQQQQQSQQHHLQAYCEYQSAAAAGAMNLNTKAQSHLNAHHQHHLPQLPVAHPNQHSSPFAEMSSQLVARVAAASQFPLDQQQHQQHQQHQQQQQQQQQQQVGENLIKKRSPSVSSISAHAGNQAKQSPPPPAPPLSGASQQQQPQPVSHQPKKSRLLSNFYQQEREKEQQLQQQLREQANIKQHLNLGSLNNSQQVDQFLGSPLGGAQGKLSAAHEQIKGAKLAAHQLITSGGGGAGSVGGSLSHQSQTALHETLVRSLLQLKQQNEHNNHRGFDRDHHHHHSLASSRDLVAALAQQQQQRTLLESLASLSSGGTGSIVDPASNSPTERTATPPSGPPSPHRDGRHAYSSPALADNSMALNLAKSSMNSSKRQRHESQVGTTTNDETDADEDYAIKVDDDDDDSRGRRTSAVDNEMAASPLDGTKKVRKFLEDQMARLAAGGEHQDDADDRDLDDGTGSRDQSNTRRRSIKREACSSDDDDDDDHQGQNQDDEELPIRSFKQRKMSRNNAQGERKQDLNFISKLLVSEICNRRGRGQLMDELALDEAAKYTQCFLDVLIDDASLIAGHSGQNTSKSEGETSSASSSSSSASLSETGARDEDGTEDLDEQAARSESDKTHTSKRQKRSSTSGNQDEPIDVSSLSLALKLIPSKLIAAVQAASCGAGKPQRVQCEPPVSAAAIETS